MAEGVTATRLGVVTDADALRIEGQFTVSLRDLQDAHESTLPRIFAE